LKRTERTTEKPNTRKRFKRPPKKEEEKGASGREGIRKERKLREVDLVFSADGKTGGSFLT